MTDEIIKDVETAEDKLSADETNEETDTPEKTKEEAEESKTSEPEKAEKSKELQSALAQKEHWRKKYEQAVKSGVKPKPVTEDEWKNKVEFLIKNRDYNEEEFDHIANVATRKGVSLEDAAKQESEYIAFRRQKVISEKKTPLPSSAASVSFEKKIDSKTPSEEIDKILEERFNAVKQGKDSGC